MAALLPFLEELVHVTLEMNYSMYALLARPAR